MYIIMALLGFSLLVIIHELGHFLLARLNGIKVEEFAIGMGPQIFSHKGKETQYSFRLLPIGGYVKMLGEDESVSDEKSFSSKSPLRRISVILAGATMNIIFAVVVFVIVFSSRGFTVPIISDVLEDSVAMEVGLEPGDRIKEINGDKVYIASDVSIGVQLSKGEEIDLLIERNGKEESFLVTPRIVEVDGVQEYRIGFGYTRIAEPTIGESLKQTYNETISLIGQTYKSLGLMITGNVNFKTDVGGPVTIIKMSGEAAKGGILQLAYFLAFISVNLAVFNLLPFPALDGGWAVILFIELITRRKVPDKILGLLNTVGFIILMGFMLLVTLKDIIFPVQF